MSNIYDEITVEDFKAQFARNFPYLPVYVSEKVYFEGDEVYSEPNFYQSLINNNDKPLSDTEMRQNDEDYSNCKTGS